MSKLPLISVIVPAYQAEKYLHECCQSVYAQTYSNWELIIVNDGSRDRTAAIADQEKAQHENVVVIHGENGGVCRARNIGLDAARGDYIAFLDADDLLCPDALETLYAVLCNNEADMAIGWKTNMRPDGTEIGCPYVLEHGLWIDTQGLEQSLRDYPATYAVWGKLYKKELIGQTRFVEGKRVHEDSFFVFECLMKCPRVVLCDQVVIRYRISENSASRSGFSEKMFDILYFADRKKEIVLQQYPQFQILTENMIVKANMALLGNLCKIDAPRYRKAEKDCLRAVFTHKASFIPATPRDRRWFFILTHHLYRPYKLLVLMRKK